MVSVNERRLKLGVLTPHAAGGPEIEIPDLSKGRVTVTVTRIHPQENAAGTETTGPPTAQALRALARPEALDIAAARFGDGSVDVVAHASTTTGYVLGARSEAALVKRLAAQCGVPVVGSASAAADALRACGGQRLVLIHPPWFDNEIDQLGVGYFRDQGLDVTLLKATGLSRDPGDIRTDGVIDWVSRHLGDGDEAVFMAGNGFRSARAVAPLEQRTGRLVLQANQVLLWAILATVRPPLTIEGCGKLFGTRPTPAHPASR
jgi:maleate isomerase